MADLAFLREFPRYAIFTDEELKLLGATCSEKEYARHAHVFKQFETEDKSLYIIRQGKVHVIRQEARVKKVLASFGRGDFFGEMALLDSGPRSASAECGADTTLIALPQGRFEYLEGQSPTLALKLIKVFAKELVLRLRATDETLVPREKFFPSGKAES